MFARTIHTVAACSSLCLLSFNALAQSSSVKEEADRSGSSTSADTKVEIKIERPADEAKPLDGGLTDESDDQAKDAQRDVLMPTLPHPVKLVGEASQELAVSGGRQKLALDGATLDATQRQFKAEDAIKNRQALRKPMSKPRSRVPAELKQREPIAAQKKQPSGDAALNARQYEFKSEIKTRQPSGKPASKMIRSRVPARAETEKPVELDRVLVANSDAKKWLERCENDCGGVLERPEETKTPEAAATPGLETVADGQVKDAGDDASLDTTADSRIKEKDAGADMWWTPIYGFESHSYILNVDAGLTLIHLEVASDEPLNMYVLDAKGGMIASTLVNGFERPFMIESLRGEEITVVIENPSRFRNLYSLIVTGG